MALSVTVCSQSNIFRYLFSLDTPCSVQIVTQEALWPCLLLYAVSLTSSGIDSAWIHCVLYKP